MCAPVRVDADTLDPLELVLQTVVNQHGCCEPNSGSESEVCSPQLNILFFFLYLSRECVVCMLIHVLWCVYGGQRTTAFRRWFSPPTMWILRIKLRLLGLVASSLTQQTISSTPSQRFLVKLEICVVITTVQF